MGGSSLRSPRRPRPGQPWSTAGAIVIPSVEEGLRLANAFAPEHLCLLVRDPWSYVGQVRHAGGVFVGSSSPEAAGDYVAGPSHIMPTAGTARFASPLSVDDFVKIVSVVGLSPARLEEVGPVAAAHGPGGGFRGPRARGGRPSGRRS